MKMFNYNLKGESKAFSLTLGREDENGHVRIAIFKDGWLVEEFLLRASEIRARLKAESHAYQG